MSQHICTVCGYEGRGKKQLRGSRFMEVLIWTSLVIPGPLYSIWRRSGVVERCPNCERGHMVSPRSDAGYLAKKRLEIELEGSKNSHLLPQKSSSFSDSAEAFTDQVKEEIKRAPVDPDAW
jgi:hypothetical protein